LELENRTPVAAEILAVEVHEAVPRMGFLVAKATFRFTEDGSVELEREDPLPIFEADEELEDGFFLPRDTIPKNDEAFEVMLVGHAHSPSGRPVERMHVTLGVGDTYQHLLVTGDRWWRIQLGSDGWPDPSACVPTDPAPFTRLPLDWTRSWGGEAEVLIDHDSPLTFADPLNGLGKGFDPTPAARGFVEHVGAPEGFPVIEWVRALPNVEDPLSPITHWEDEPDPAGWAPLPISSGIRAMAIPMPDSEEDASLFASLERPQKVPPEILHRAHPDWVLPSTPPAGASIFLRGLVAGVSELAFPLPSLRVLADYEVGEHSGTRELRPDTLVLLPDERRFYLVYRSIFRYNFDPMSERCFRLRLATGWYSPIQSSQT